MIFQNANHMSLEIAILFKHYNSLANMYKVRVTGDHILELIENGSSLNKKV